MIAAYCGNSEIDFYKDTDTYRNQVAALLNAGMLQSNTRSPAGFGYKFQCTAKGKFWLDFVLNTPYPVEVKKFKIPKGANNEQ